MRVCAGGGPIRLVLSGVVSWSAVHRSPGARERASETPPYALGRTRQPRAGDVQSARTSAHGLVIGMASDQPHRRTAPKVWSTPFIRREMGFWRIVESLAGAPRELTRAHQELTRAHQELARAPGGLTHAHQELTRAPGELTHAHQGLTRAPQELMRAHQRLRHAPQERRHTR